MHDWPVRVSVNGVPTEGTVEPRLTLADYLRENCGLTGTHLGCEHGACGACTVMVDGQAVRACLMFAVQADGSEVTTVEGIAAEDGELSPVQSAMRECHGLQCGFCTPGFVVSITALLRDNPEAHRRGGPRGPVRQFLQVHRLPGHRQRRTSCGGIDLVVRFAPNLLAAARSRPRFQRSAHCWRDPQRGVVTWHSNYWYRIVLVVVGAANDRTQHREFTPQDHWRPRRWRRGKRIVRERRIRVSPNGERVLWVNLRSLYRHRLHQHVVQCLLRHRRRSGRHRHRAVKPGCLYRRRSGQADAEGR